MQPRLVFYKLVFPFYEQRADVVQESLEVGVCNIINRYDVLAGDSHHATAVPVPLQATPTVFTPPPIG